MRQQHSPLPWAIDPDPELDWNFHIVQENAPHMRVCFMTSNGPSQANAELIVRSVNALPALVSALEEARLQIEYLHEKFRETGTGNAVLNQIDGALASVRTDK